MFEQKAYSGSRNAVEHRSLAELNKLFRETLFKKLSQNLFILVIGYWGYDKEIVQLFNQFCKTGKVFVQWRRDQVKSESFIVRAPELLKRIYISGVKREGKDVAC